MTDDAIVHNSNGSHHDIVDTDVVQSIDLDIYEQPLQVIYQDLYMLVINKPQGMTVMGDKPSLIRCNLLMPYKCTIAEQQELLATAVSTSSNDDGNDKNKNKIVTDKVLGKPRPVHRLDNGTGGLLVIAKTHYSDQQLRTSFMNRTCKKRYRALLIGKLTISKLVSLSTSLSSCLEPVTIIMRSNEHECNIDKIESDISQFGRQEQAPNNYDAKIIANVNGKESQTLLRIVRHIEKSTLSATCRHTPKTDSIDAPVFNQEHEQQWYTIVDLWPITGRRHQLRKHMKLIGYSIYGDTRYVATSILAANHQNKRKLHDHEQQEQQLTNRCNSSDGFAIVKTSLQDECNSRKYNVSLTESIATNNNSNENISIPITNQAKMTSATTAAVQESQPQHLSQQQLEQLHNQSHSDVKQKPLSLCLWAMEITIPHPKTGIPITLTLPNHDDPHWFDSYIV